MNKSIPETFDIKKFEEDILSQIENPDHKKILKSAYQKKEQKYQLMEDADNKEIKSIFESANLQDLVSDDIPKPQIDENLLLQIKEKEHIIADLQKKIADYEDVIRRRQAEFENYKKRTAREKEDFQITANQKIIVDLLPIVDNLEKALESFEEKHDVDALKDGIILIEKQFKKNLQNHGLQTIESLEQEFDPNLHEALQIDESNKNYKHDTVITEWQKGYMLNDKVIRHSKVVVAKGNSNYQDTYKIPFSFSKDIFEEQVLNSIQEEDQKKLFNDVYQLKNDHYYLQEDYKNKLDVHDKIDEILKSINYSELNINSH